MNKEKKTGVIYGINGPVVYLKGNTGFKMSEMVYVGEEKLVGEVIALDKDLTTVQVYEETTGLRPGEEVVASGSAVSVTLAPGILNNIFDGIERPLERIADFADGIARHVIEEECAALPDSFKEELRVGTMFDTVISMLSDSFVALESENTKLSGRILAKDETVDEIYHDDIRLLAEYMQKEPVQARCVLDTLLVLRKIERIGDHCSNIVEEIVFYIDAKILKHNRNKE